LSASRISREIPRIFLLCTCAVLGPHTVSALDPNRTTGEYVATQWGSRDSFPGGTIHAIAQTPDGYLWIAADDGLVRFDGVSFREFDHANTPSLPAGHVLGLVVDSQGVLWVRMGSPYLMRYRERRFEQAYPVEVPPPFSPARERGATAVVRGVRGDILIAPPNGPLRYSAGKFTPLVSSGAAAGLAISIAETADGAVWIGMRDTGLYCVRAGRALQLTGLPDQKVNALLPGTGPELWIGTDSGLVRWDGNAITQRGVPAPLARSPILALARDRDSNLWISTPANIARMDSNGVAIQAAAGRVPGTVRAIFEDREGNLWFGGTNGLMQLRDAPFRTYTDVAGEGGSVYVDASGRPWIGPSSGGLLWLRGAEHHPIAGLGLEPDEIYSISGGPAELWLGRKLGGVMQLREEAGMLHARTSLLSG
jgi:ligand-binding sensor domain-containing protein